MSAATTYVCDFCGQAKESNRRLIAGEGNEKHICDDCVRKAKSILAEEAAVEGGLDKGRKVVSITEVPPDVA